MPGTAKFTRWSNYTASVRWPEANWPRTRARASAFQILFVRAGRAAAAAFCFFFSLRFGDIARFLAGFIFRQKKRRRYGGFLFYGRKYFVQPSFARPGPVWRQSQTNLRRTLVSASYTRVLRQCMSMWQTEGERKGGEKGQSTPISSGKTTSFSLETVATSVSQQFRARGDTDKNEIAIPTQSAPMELPGKRPPPTRRL